MPHSIFPTSDIALASFLLTAGYRLSGVETGHNGKAVFCSKISRVVQTMSSGS